MPAILVALVVYPVVVAAACLFLPVRAAQALSVLSGVAAGVLTIVLVPAVAHQDVTIGFLRLDALGAVFLLANGFLYAVLTVYSVGYFRAEEQLADFPRYARRFYAGFNVFAWAMLVAPLVTGLALLWIAVEITTVVSALLVAIDDTDAASEAAWKYVLIASSGLGIGLLGTIVMYSAGASVIGAHYDLAFAPLLAVSHHLPATPIRLAFVLAVVGYGTKMGLVPVHTWLPDAHSEAPTPVSALLSAGLLSTSFYAILRFYQVAVGTLGPGFPQGVLLVFGVLSLLLAALSLLGQHDVKRLLAYSSVEHMGILAIGIGFGAPLAYAGVLLHVLAHAAAKANAFMGAGSFLRRYRTKELGVIRAGLDVLPWSAPLFLLAILALSALPPFGIFRSEFEIVAGGLASGRHVFAVVLVVLVTVAFAGLSWAATRLVRAPAPAGGRPLPPRGETSAWMVVPMVAGLVVLLILGVHPPGDLADLLARGVAELGSTR
ncbi:MAG: proton-conducting transporter transmembrane domain-containing protein [Actinomycetes bacterium]